MGSRPLVAFLATAFALVVASCAGEAPRAVRPVRFGTVPLTWGAGDSLGAALMAAGLGVSSVGVLGPERGVTPRAGVAVLAADHDRPADRAAVEAWLRRRSEVASVGDSAAR